MKKESKTASTITKKFVPGEMFLTSPGSAGLVYIETSTGFAAHRLRGKRPGRKIVEVSESRNGARLIKFSEAVSRNLLEDISELVNDPPFERGLPCD